jgi:glutaredoxin
MTELYTLLVYTADGCAHCAALCADLRLRGVRFLELNLSREPERLAELARVTGERRLPVVVDHERVSVGFRGGASTFAELGLS